MHQQQLFDWIREHAPLTCLCENGGWPDLAHMQIAIRDINAQECIVDIEFTESSMEISECSIHQASHGGEFVISLDADGNPVDIRLLNSLWSPDEPLL